MEAMIDCTEGGDPGDLSKGSGRGVAGGKESLLKRGPFLHSPSSVQVDRSSGTDQSAFSSSSSDTKSMKGHLASSWLRSRALTFSVETCPTLSSPLLRRQNSPLSPVGLSNSANSKGSGSVRLPPRLSVAVLPLLLSHPPRSTSARQFSSPCPAPASREAAGCACRSDVALASSLSTRLQEKSMSTSSSDRALPEQP